MKLRIFAGILLALLTPAIAHATPTVICSAADAIGNPIKCTPVLLLDSSGAPVSLANATNQTATQANPGSNATKADGVQGIDGGKPVAVEPRSPAPAATATATIASGASLSGAIDLASERLHRINIPAAGWTAAGITFQASSDGTNYYDLYDTYGEVALASTSVAASRSVIVDQGTFLGIRYLKIRSGTGAAAVTQAALRSLDLVTVAR